VIPPLVVTLGYTGKLFTMQMHVFAAYLIVVGFNVSNCMLSLVAFTRWVHFVKPQLSAFFTKKRQIISILVVFGINHVLYAPFFFDYSLITPIGDSSWF